MSYAFLFLTYDNFVNKDIIKEFTKDQNIYIHPKFPNNVDNYLHRIGRSGRYGRKGVSINFATFYDKKKIQDIESHYGIEIEELPNDLNCLL